MKHSPRNPHFMKHFLLTAACFVTACTAVQAQGYHLGRPMNEDAFEALLLAHSATQNAIQGGAVCAADAAQRGSTACTS